jgi:hypothetical protein
LVLTAFWFCFTIHLQWLKTVLKVAVQHARFYLYFTHPDFILAAISHLKFKLYWVEDATDKARITNMLEVECTPVASAVEFGDHDIASSLSDKDHQFFVMQRSTKSASSQYLAYLSDSDCTFDMLSEYPAVKTSFIKYNTVLPSSAVVERVFSAAAIILSQCRNRLSDNTFEK